MIYMAPELGFSSALAVVSRIICTPALHFILPRLTLASGNQNGPLFLHPPLAVVRTGQRWTRNRFQRLRTGWRPPCQRSRRRQQQSSRTRTMSGTHRLAEKIM